MNKHGLLRALCVGILLGLPATAARSEQQPGNLSGTWKLNRDASDDPRKKMEEMQSQGGGSGSGSGGGWSGGSGRHGGHRGYGGGSSQDGSSSDAMTDRAATWQSLQIEHADPQLIIRDGAGREHTYFTDGRKTEEERSFGGTTKIKAQWKEGHVVVEIDPEKGRSYTETYSVTADHKQLTVTTRFKSRGSRGDVEIRRVYDAAAPAAPEPVESSAPQTGS